MSTIDPGATAPADPAAHRQERISTTRTGWDIVLGLVLVVTGVVVLGDVVIASVISVLFLGWTLLIGGAVGVVLAFFRIGHGGFWIGMLGGVLALVAGLAFVRHPDVALVALSLAIGSIMLVSGIVRLVAAVQHPEMRLMLAVSGVLSLALGLLILYQWPTSALWLIGTLLGVQLIVDGVSLVAVGRPRLVRA
jgi:membrane protein HdeD